MDAATRRAVFSGLCFFISCLVPFQPAATAAADDDFLKSLEAIRAKHQLPALGGAVVTTEKLEWVGAVGVRSLGAEAKVTADDQWHLGSDTKAMTATLIALLVERGDLRFETTLAEGFPKLKDSMWASYRNVPLAQLLTHRAGVPSDLQRDGLWGRLFESTAPPLEQRELLTSTVLSWGPEQEPGSHYLYSNAGFAIAGHLAETRTGKPYEELMQKLLFDPLEMKSAGFGAPGVTGKLDQPVGHDGARRPVPPGKGSDNPPAIAPAGTVHASLADWAKFVQLHLRGAHGDVKLGAITLYAATFQKLHAPVPGDDASYAMGWGVSKCDWAGGDHTVLTHNGSNTMWYCTTTLAPAAGFAVLVTTNLAGASGPKACNEASWALTKEYLARTEELRKQRR